MAAAAFVAGLLLALTLNPSFSGAATYIVRINHALKPSVFPTPSHWYASLFAAAGDGAISTLHVYDTVFHGFAADLSPSLADALRSHPAVLAVIPDRRRELATTRSPQFLGLRARLGLWSLSDYGSDVVVGVLDTGVWPERRSLAAVRGLPLPSKFRGGCDAGESFSADLCNNKLVAARFFASGHIAYNGAAAAATNGSSGEYLSPRDADGHGTHTATTAAGGVVFGASMGGYAAGVAKGVAPKARIASYKVCWKDSGCMDSDILAGFDRAVADGADVLSISIGGGQGASTPFYLDPIAIGAFGAAARGVFVAVSAGNEGPSAMSVINLAPWFTTVGAGTIDRSFPAEIVLGDGRRIAGVSLYSGRPLPNGTMLPLVYPGLSGGMSAALCMENSLDPELVAGKIVICDRGNSARVAKGLVVKDAGAAGMILTNLNGSGEGLVGDAHVLPACAVGSDEGNVLKSYVNASGSGATATIAFRGTMVGIKPAPVVAAFSSRGPSGLIPELLKPDIIAPGVNILAAWTGATGPTGLTADLRRTEFNILSGTSMACPHVSGAAALLKSMHPGWSPAAVRSAMMTTATVSDNRRTPIMDESMRGRAASPFDMGAGHLNLGKAMDPGLVYDLTAADYVTFLCATGYEPNSIEVITHEPVTCGPAKARNAADLNYPSMAAAFDAGLKNQTRTLVRTVTNVGANAAAVYHGKVAMTDGSVSVTLHPRTLRFSESVKKRAFTVTVSAAAAPASGSPAWGHIVWSDGEGHEVRSPIVVSWFKVI